jgi:AcrR family transcriptional regulator
MGRPRKTAGESTKLKLLRAAELEFGATGYHRARLEDIAAGAGIKRASLLYHYGSKENLYAQVVAAAYAELMGTIAVATIQPGDGMDRVDAVVEALIGFAQTRRAAVSMFIRELLDGAPDQGRRVPEIVLALDALEQFVRAQLTQLPPTVPLRSAILNLFTSQALRFASGDLGDQLWDADDDPRLFIRSLLETVT